MHRQSLGSRGYIGPLGDDFPSMFPLLLGLIIFFSAVFTAYLTYQAKEDMVQALRANLLISRAVRYRVYFDSDYWDTICPMAQALGTNYKVHTVLWLEEHDTSESESSLVTFDSGPAVCPNDESFWKGDVPDSLGDLKGKILEKTDGRESTTMTYPVLVSEEVDREDNAIEINKIARLVVVTWR